VEYGLTNISSAGYTVLRDFDEYGGSVESIRISNNHASNDATINLYFDHTTDGQSDDSHTAGSPAVATACFICKNLVIPGGTSVLFDEGLSFDTSVSSLIIRTAGTSLHVSVIIR